MTPNFGRNKSVSKTVGQVSVGSQTLGQKSLDARNDIPPSQLATLDDADPAQQYSDQSSHSLADRPTEGALNTFATSRSSSVVDERSESSSSSSYQQARSVPSPSPSNVSQPQCKGSPGQSGRGSGQQSRIPLYRPPNLRNPIASLPDYTERTLPSRESSDQHIVSDTSRDQPSSIARPQPYPAQETNAPQLGYNDYLMDIQQNAQFLWGMDAKYNVITGTPPALQLDS